MAYDFNKDINKVYRIVREYFNLGESVYDYLYSSKTEQFEYDEHQFFYLLYDIVNYDLISLYGRKINIKNSNHPELARVLKRWATEDNINMVYDRLYIR